MLSHRPELHRTALPFGDLRRFKPFLRTACVNCTGGLQIVCHTQATQNEVRPIVSWFSKGLYRYTIILDIICQIIAYQDTEWSESELE